MHQYPWCPQCFGDSEPRRICVSIPSVFQSLDNILDLKSQMAQVLEYLVRQQALPPSPALAPPPALAPVLSPSVPAVDNVSDRDEVMSKGDQDAISIMAFWDGDSLEQQETEPIVSELRLVSGMLLQISGFQGQDLGRSLAGLVVVRRQLWLCLLRVPDADKSDLLYTPIFPGHTFVEEMKVAVMLPSCAPVWDMFKPWRLAVTMVTRTILIPTALCGNLRHRLQASVAANTQGCQQEWVNTGHVAPAHQRSGKQFPRPQTHPFSQHQLQYWRNCTSDSWVPTTVQTSYTLQFRAGPPFRGITVTSMSDPLQVLALRQEVDTLL
ncbi:UNVERIFIED_CONTAM: hypothetical protein FKN15_013682 [Acipenser sinensis]